METIHSETYALLIETYIRDEAEKAHLFNAIEEIDGVARKANWRRAFCPLVRERGSKATVRIKGD